jgi:hypothetical protein
MNGAQVNSVSNLQNLYSVVVGLAVSMAIVNLIDTNRAVVPVKVEFLPFFAAFLFTLVPFYHGALRHLDVTYVEGAIKDLRRGALLADFAFLFAESCVLFCLALLLPAPQFLAWGLVALLAVDSFWAFMAHLAFSAEKKPSAEARWAWINVVACLVLILFLLFASPFPPTSDLGGARLMIGLPVIALFRTVVDYALCWDTYFPPLK